MGARGGGCYELCQESKPLECKRIIWITRMQARLTKHRSSEIMIIYVHTWVLCDRSRAKLLVHASPVEYIGHMAGL